MPATIRMTRESDGRCADVHPAEVDEYRKGGFEPADGESGGSVKGFHSTAAKGARNRKGKGK